MFKKLTPLLLICCLTVGFIASCSSSDPLISEAKSGLEEQNYEVTLNAANKYIEQNPQSPLGYYYKGVALGNQGQSQDSPEAANSYYQQMKEAFAKAQELAADMEEKPGELERIEAVETSIWRSEHNTAVNYASDDSVMQTVENPYEVSLAHLNNALTVQPEDTLSLGVYAQVSGMTGNYEQAAEAQKKYVERLNNPDAKKYLVLAQYYRNAEQPEEAISTLEKAREMYPDNKQVIEILADSYSQAGQSEKAIAMVEDLVEENPNETRYLLSLGTQIYQSALELQNSSDYDENIDTIFELRQDLGSASGDEQQQIQNKIDKLKSENEEILEKIDQRTDRAIEYLQTVIENEPDNTNAHNTLGVIFQNRAAVLFDKRNLTQDNQEAADLDKQAKEVLKKAMTSYEKAAQLNPDDPKYWRSLYQVYVALGMDEKAKEAEKKAGMQ